MKYLNRKNVGATTIVIVLLVCFYFLGLSNGNAVVGEEKLKYDDLLEEKAALDLRVQAKNNELYSLTTDSLALDKEIEEVNKQIAEKKEEIEEALALYEEREDIKSEISVLSKELTDKEAEISSLNEKINALSGELKRKESEPIVLSAGTFIVGHDLEPGRYIAEPVSGGGNFSSHNESDRLNFTTILRKDGHGEPEYAFFAETGDTLKLGMSVQFSSVQ